MHLLTFVLTCGSLFAGCSAGTGDNLPTVAAKRADVKTSQQARDEKIRTLVSAFASGMGDRRVLRKLEVYPREELIDSLLRVRDKAPPDDAVRVRVAFTLCHLDYEVASNKQIVASALKSDQPYPGLPADDAGLLVDGLIRGGHKDLLPVMFTAATWSDGALAGGLAEVFADEVTKDPDSFMLMLKEQPPNTRKEVIFLTLTALPKGDLERLRAHLRATRPGAPTDVVAGEMSAELSRLPDDENR